MNRKAMVIGAVSGVVAAILAAVFVMFLGLTEMFQNIFDPSDSPANPMSRKVIAFGKDRSLHYGFVDHEGKLRIRATFDDAGSFHEGLCPVSLKNQWGFIGKEGNFVIPARYERTSEFSEGLAAAREGKNWGFIDKAGKWVIKPRWRSVSDFHNGFALVANGNVRNPYNDDTPLMKGAFTAIGNRGSTARNRERSGIIDRSGNFVLPEANRSIEIEIGGARRIKESDYFGFLDSKCKIIVPPKLPKALPFAEGLAAVCTKDGGKWGFIDLSGKMVIPETFESAGSFHNGFAVAQSNAKYGLIDKTGHFVVEPIYPYLTLTDIDSLLPRDNYAAEGLVPIAFDSHWGFANCKTGETTIKPIYAEVDTFSEGLARVGVAE